MSKAGREQPRLKAVHVFDRFANSASRIAGRPIAFVLAVVVLVAWAASGPLFGYSDTWQLVINTITTLITFLMVFVIQSSQNRDSAAIQIKLDEIVRAMEGAHLALLDLEELDEDDLDVIRADYRALAAKARRDLRAGLVDTHTPDTKTATKNETKRTSAKTRRPRRQRTRARSDS
jgi:low affinity Fe/Cu permease